MALGFIKAEEVFVHFAAFGRDKGPDDSEAQVFVEPIDTLVIHPVGRQIYPNQPSLPSL